MTTHRWCLRAPPRCSGPSLARLAFFGSPPVAARFLEAVVAAGHEVSLVVTGPDRRRGRGTQLTPTAVGQMALDLHLPCAQRVGEAVGSGASLGVVVAFGQLVPATVLAALPMVNVHFSLLPRWRGAAPVQRAILAGDEITGVSLMSLEAGLDTGPVHASASLIIGADERADELTDRLATIGIDLLLEALRGLPASLDHPRPQVGEATYAAKLAPSELRLEWSRPAVELDRLIRCGRAWTVFRGRRLLVHRARVLEPPPPGIEPGAPGTLSPDGAVVTGSGLLRLVEIQREGRGAQGVDAFLAGARLGPNERLG